LQINWFLVAGIVLTWLYPYIVINQILLTIFWNNKDLMKKGKKNGRLVWRETVGEIRYLIPIYNWSLLFSLVKGQVIIDSYLKSKLEKTNK